MLYEGFDLRRTKSFKDFAVRHAKSAQFNAVHRGRSKTSAVRSAKSDEAVKDLVVRPAKPEPFNALHRGRVAVNVEHVER